MSRRASLLVFAISLAVAVATFVYASQRFEELVITVPIATAGRDIPVYTLITEEMLEVREMPRDLLREPIYQNPQEIVGLITTVPIPQGGLIYRDFAVNPEAFRLVSDPSLEVVSFPVDPAKAVGGQVMIGQRINIYRIARGTLPSGEVTPETLLHRSGAAVELLAASVLVVDVRSTRGEFVSGDAESDGERNAPLNIITVAVDPATARELVQLMGELRNQYDLWVTLAPLEMEIAAE